jgi:dUTP pyrophosphatase
MKQILGYYKCRSEAEAPVFGTGESACFDIKAHLKFGDKVKLFTQFNKEMTSVIRENGSIILKPGDRVLVPTGLVFDIPVGYSVRLHARSGLSLKSGLLLANSEAVIDSDYFNETFILLYNRSETTVTVSDGDRIAQGELVAVTPTELREVPLAPAQRTDRVGGFGSTGN